MSASLSRNAQRTFGRDFWLAFPLSFLLKWFLAALNTEDFSRRRNRKLDVWRCHSFFRTMEEPDKQPDDFNRTFWETYEEMWTNHEGGLNLATIAMPAEVVAILNAYAKERGLDPANLFSLVINQGFVKLAISRLG